MSTDASGPRPPAAHPLVGLVWAEARGGVIGAAGGMPWHVPEDLAHFKQVTLGGPVIMGRKTWDSLPERFRPLPGRTNLVVTRRPDWGAEGAVRAGSLGEALALAGSAMAAEGVDRGNASGEQTGGEGDVAGEPVSGDVTDGGAGLVWVIGGGELFAQAAPLADRLEVTELDLDVDGDAYAPAIDGSWRLQRLDPPATDGAPAWHTSRTGIRYRFASYTR